MQFCRMWVQGGGFRFGLRSEIVVGPTSAAKVVTEIHVLDLELVEKFYLLK